MFFVLSKLLNFLLRPITWVFVLLVWAVLTKNTQRKKKLLIANLVVLYFFSNSFILNEALVLWEPHSNEKTITTNRYATGIVLGGFAAYDRYLDRVVFSDAGDRLLQAVRLYEAKKINAILISGGSGSLTNPNSKEAAFVRTYLLEIGIPDSAILIETESRNTFENALNTNKLLREKKLDTGHHLLVTSAMHMPRAMACFQNQNIKVTAYPVQYMGDKKRELGFDEYFMPSIRTFYTWELLIKEWIGSVIYKIKGYS